MNTSLFNLSSFFMRAAKCPAELDENSLRYRQLRQISHDAQVMVLERDALTERLEDLNRHLGMANELLAGMNGRLEAEVTTRTEDLRITNNQLQATNLRVESSYSELMEAQQVILTSHQEGDTVFLDFADNGKGMTEEVRKHLFEPFFTTRRNRGGTGLGLFIVHHIVTNRLRGRITVDYGEGRGTIFHLTFPAIT